MTLFAWGFVTLWGAALVTTWAGLLLWLGKDGEIPGRSLRRRWLRRFLQRNPPPESKPFLTRSPATPAPSWLRVLMAVALWCTLEAIWSHGPLYWTSLAFTQSPHNLAILHLGRLSGPTFVSGAIVAVNGLLAEAWIWMSQQERSRAKRLLVWSVGWFVVLHLVGLGLYRQPLVESPETALNVGIIQGNVPTRIKHFEEGVRMSLEHYTQGYEVLVDQGVDAVLTPEGAFPWHWIETSRRAQHPFDQVVRARGVLAWIGTVGVQQGRITQSLFTLDGTGQILSRYDKIKPVPLGEYIPFEAFLGNFISRLSPVEASMIPGRPDQQVDTPFGQAIVGICFDSAFSFLFRQQAATGGQFILTASNNDPYELAMMTQHHAQDVMRAIETDRWAARATNTGLSGVIDPHGRSQWISGFRTYEIHAHTLYRRQTQTLYVRWGDWGLGVLIGLAIGGKLWEIKKSGGRRED
ncbi:apolipoprotein N-acyltransferase [Egbenema bharatensis]|uniref:apolipoprotein N-acyltransferase n=1 Tax=Egbenema bharatensis TaxID=3463334 RepID=UPI003A89B578